ncbi:MAG TPA: hypothetical protein VGN23_02015 [Verrucomicrobiae bacterium]
MNHKLNQGFARLILLFVCLSFPLALHAQSLVADSQTVVLDDVATNLAGTIVGTAGPYTVLDITDGSVVTNSGGYFIIGDNTSSVSNQVVVTDPGSAILSTSSIYVGLNGSYNELDILNGGTVSGNGAIGEASGSNNLAVISGASSVWTNAGGFFVGNGGPNNRLVLTNGGQIWINGYVTMGENMNTISNSALITGTNSLWNSGYCYVGYIGSGWNQIAVHSGGAFIDSSYLDIGTYANSNLFLVADTNSSARCVNYRIGYSSSGNQCVVSNGATLLVSNNSSIPTMVEGTFTAVTITGAHSLWTNNVDFDFGQYSNLLVITNGGRLVDNNGYVQGNTGNNPKTNTVVVAGTNSMWNSLQNLSIADSGAQMFITNGGTVIDINGFVGTNSGDNNCFVLVDGLGSLWTNRVNLLDGNNDGSFNFGGNGATNTLLVADSGKLAAPDIYVNNNSRLIVSNAATLLAIRDAHNGGSGDLYIGNSSSPNWMIVTNATANIGYNLQIGNFGGGGSSSNTLIINNGAVVVSNGVTIASPGSLVMNSGSLRSGIISIANYAMQTNAIVLNGGTMQATGISTPFEAYPVPLTVGDGVDAASFQMLNNGTFSGGFTIANNASLIGGGTINGSVIVGNGGTFAPGITNIASVTLNGGLVLGAGTTNIMALQPGSTFSTIQGLTNIVYGGTFLLTNLGGSYASGQSFQLFSSSQYSGAFNNLVPATPGSGLRWDTNELNIDGTLRVFSTTTPPPAASGISQAAGALSISATGGIPYDPCYLLTSTNPVAPLVDWSCITTNYFDTNGATTFTNTISPDQPEQYFLLQVN